MIKDKILDYVKSLDDRQSNEIARELWKTYNKMIFCNTSYECFLELLHCIENIGDANASCVAYNFELCINELSIKEKAEIEDYIYTKYGKKVKL